MLWPLSGSVLALDFLAAAGPERSKLTHKKASPAELRARRVMVSARVADEGESYSLLTHMSAETLTASSTQTPR